MYKEKVVVIGGGIGGIVTVNHLAEILPEETEIVLIEKNKNHSFAASYLWLMVNKRKSQKITSPLSKLINKRVSIIFEEINQIDTQNKIVNTENSQIPFDYLVIALGSSLDPTFLDKQSSGIHNFYTLQGSEELKKALNNFNGGSVAILVSSLPYKCPGAPYEAAMLINDYLNKKLKDNFTLNIYTPEPLPLPVAGPELGNSIKNILNDKGISFNPLTQMTAINYKEKKVEFASGDSITYDLLVLIPSHKAPEVISISNLPDESGWIPVNKDTLETRFKNIFSIGDVTSITIPGRWLPDRPLKLPKAGVFAHSQAIAVSQIINSKIRGKEPEDKFCADGFCMLEAGEDLAGFAYGDFYSSPHPEIKMKQLGKFWHWGKILFEKWWLAPQGFIKSFYGRLIEMGGKSMNIPVKL